MKLLVTGANGFVGTALCTVLRVRGIAHTAAMRDTVGSIGPATDWRPALQGCDVVVHLAGRAHQPAGEDTTALYATNVAGTLRLAQQAAAAGVQRLVFMSSIKAWGEVTLPGQAARESDESHPQDAYGLSKHKAERGLRQISQDTGMAIVIIRPPLVYGPQARANFAALLRAVQRGWPLPLGAVRNTRSFIGVDNLVDFVLLCAQHPAAADQTFHVSDGADLSTAALVQGMARAANVKTRLLAVPVGVLKATAWLLGKGEAVQRLTGNLQLDISQARNQLGWRAPVSVDEGLRRAVTAMEQA